MDVINEDLIAVQVRHKNALQYCKEQHDYEAAM